MEGLHFIKFKNLMLFYRTSSWPTQQVKKKSIHQNPIQETQDATLM